MKKVLFLLIFFQLYRELEDMFENTKKLAASISLLKTVEVDIRLAIKLMKLT